MTAKNLVSGIHDFSTFLSLAYRMQPLCILKTLKVDSDHA